MEVIITDTVGFIRNLPTELLQAFRATLEELEEADVLLHVIDISNPRFEQQLSVVEDLLLHMDIGTIPVLRIFNKIDQVTAAYADNMKQQYDAIPISALDRTTFGPMLDKARRMVLEKWCALQNCNRDTGN